MDEIADSKLTMLVLSLEAKLGRKPTEDEVSNFIFGDSEMRQRIWEGKFGDE